MSWPVNWPGGPEGVDAQGPEACRCLKALRISASLGGRKPHEVTVALVTVSKTRGFLYQLARFLGDYQAVKNGRVGKLDRTTHCGPRHGARARAIVQSVVGGRVSPVGSGSTFHSSSPGTSGRSP